MKLLVDMNLSPRWVGVLVDAGIEVAHCSKLGAQRAGLGNHGLRERPRLRGAHPRS